MSESIGQRVARAAWMDVWQIDVLFAWLDHKITEGATR